MCAGLDALGAKVAITPNAPGSVKTQSLNPILNQAGPYWAIRSADEKPARGLVAAKHYNSAPAKKTSVSETTQKAPILPFRAWFELSRFPSKSTKSLTGY